MNTGKVEFELLMLDLLNLPKTTTEFTLRCKYNEIPVVTCAYELLGSGESIIEETTIKTWKKKYRIKLEEIKTEEGKNDD